MYSSAGDSECGTTVESHGFWRLVPLFVHGRSTYARGEAQSQLLREAPPRRVLLSTGGSSGIRRFALTHEIRDY